MSFEFIVGGVVSAGLMVYLIYALFNAENL